MAEQATVNIPKDILEPIVRAQVTAWIIKAFGDPAELIASVVERALSQKVDETGKVSSYQSENKFTMIEALSRKMIHEIAKRMLQDYMETQRPKIEKALKATLSRQHGKFGTAMIEGLTKAIDNKYRFECSLSIKD